MDHTRYHSPLTTRYASQEMSNLFSDQYKYSTWRKLWVALAKAEAELGLPISQQQIDELVSHIDDIDFDQADQFESVMHHDVMAHIHAYAEQCPSARAIIHLGATSCYVTDNTDIIQMREGLQLLIAKLQKVIYQIAQFAKQYAYLPCLGFTHFQPAQLTTVGKRACLWIQELLIDLKELKYRKDHLRFLGVKGTTGTQASFLALFNGDHQKVEMLDHLVTIEMGFQYFFLISGQTYTRKLDVMVLNALAGIGMTAHKFATDLRLLTHLKEVEEPFGKQQIGSSAMPYKRNPILSERVCSLSRFLIALAENPAYTASTQWLERSLDDSANRRLSIAEAFLCCDAILKLLDQITKGLEVYPKLIAKHVEDELPFIATENILMAAVKKGGNRQELHEKLRQYSHETVNKIKQEGKENDLLKRIKQDEAFMLTNEDLINLLKVEDFIGRAPAQVEEFLKTEVFPNLEEN